MQFTYEFEAFEEDGWICVYPFDMEGATSGKDRAEAADMAADWLRMEIEHRLMHGIGIPKPSFGNELQKNGYIMIVSVEVSLDTINKVTASKAAEILGVTPARISHMIRDGLLTAFRDGNRTWVTRDSINARLADNRRAGRPRKKAETTAVPLQSAHMTG